MFDIGSYPVRTCAGVSRRSLLRVAASAPLAMGLSGARLLAEPKTSRAKSVIFVFLWGAPSHLDTCDPKPDAPTEYRGPFGVIATRTPGVHFTELLPRLAQQSHRFNLIRTHVTSRGPAGKLPPFVSLARGVLMEPAARGAFDLTRETPAVRARYGRTVFGQSALLARRLVEAGVPYVQLNDSRHPEAFTPGFEFG